MSTLLEELQTRRQTYLAQREQVKVNFDQLCGALHVVEEMISELEKQEALKTAEGEKEDGDVKHEEQEQAPQE